MLDMVLQFFHKIYVWKYLQWIVEMNKLRYLIFVLKSECRVQFLLFIYFDLLYYIFVIYHVLKLSTFFLQMQYANSHSSQCSIICKHIFLISFIPLCVKSIVKIFMVIYNKYLNDNAIKIIDY